MSTYFHGRRQKLGVVTLVLACAFMGVWVRSTIIAEEFDYATSATSCQIIGLLDGHLAWLNFQDIKPTHMPEFGYYPNEPFQTFDKFYNDQSKTWNWRFYGFAVGKTENPGKITILVVSFWWIIIPLTLLSAWLLLSKPDALILKERQLGKN